MNPAVDSQTTPSTVTLHELIEEMRRGPVQLVNVLEQPRSGSLRIIPGSKHIPLSALEGRLRELDRDRDVVVYCANAGCNTSAKAAAMLARWGFRARRYPGGIDEWIATGAATEPAHRE